MPGARLELHGPTGRAQGWALGKLVTPAGPSSPASEERLRRQRPAVPGSGAQCGILSLATAKHPQAFLFTYYYCCCCCSPCPLSTHTPQCCAPCGSEATARVIWAEAAVASVGTGRRKGLLGFVRASVSKVRGYMPMHLLKQAALLCLLLPFAPASPLVREPVPGWDVFAEAPGPFLLAASVGAWRGLSPPGNLALPDLRSWRGYGRR